MKAAFLIRCSTKNQDLNRQTRDLTRLAKSMGYEYDLENLVYGERLLVRMMLLRRIGILLIDC